MAEVPEIKESLQESLQQVIHLLGKHKLIADLVRKQELDMPKQLLVETLVDKQNLVLLQKNLINFILQT